MNGLYFIEKGKGEKNLVFLHYFGGSSRTWEKVIDRLENLFHCVAIDLPGFGASETIKKATIESTTEKVQSLIEGLMLKQYVLIGHSMGGKIALAMAANQPKGLRQLILAAPSPPTPQQMDNKKRDELLTAYGDETQLEKLAKSLVAKPLDDGQLKTIIRDNVRIQHIAWKDWINIGSQEDISGQMKNVQVPITLISGSRDPNFSTKFLKRAFDAFLPYPTFIEIENNGHLLPIESPDTLADVLKHEILKMGSVTV